MEKVTNVLHSFGENLSNIQLSDTSTINMASSMKTAVPPTSPCTSQHYKKTRRGRKTGRRHKRNELSNQISGMLNGSIKNIFKTINCMCCSRKILLLDVPGSSPLFTDATIMKMCIRCSRLFPEPSSWSELETVHAMKSSVVTSNGMSNCRIPLPAPNMNSDQFVVDRNTSPDDIINFFHTDSSLSFRVDDGFDTQVQSPLYNNDQEINNHTIDCTNDTTSTSCLESNETSGFGEKNCTFEDFVKEQFELEYNQFKECQLSDKSCDELISGIKSLMETVDNLESPPVQYNTKSDLLETQEELRKLRAENQQLTLENTKLKFGTT